MANHEKHKIEYYICDENNNDSGYRFCYFLKGQVVDRFVLFYVYFYLYYIITSFPLGVRDKGANGHFKSQIFNTQIIDNISTNHKNVLKFAPAAIYY